jgi:hypothetical protein
LAVQVLERGLELVVQHVEVNTCVAEGLLEWRQLAPVQNAAYWQNMHAASAGALRSNHDGTRYKGCWPTHMHLLPDGEMNVHTKLLQIL